LVRQNDKHFTHEKESLAILLIAISLVECKSYSALEKTPTAQLPAKLPAMELILDEQSFATVAGYENHENPSEVTIAETFKLCLEDLNTQIKGDYAQLSQYFN